MISTAATDITDKVTISELKVVTNVGVEISTKDKIQVNDTVQLNYSLKIDQKQSSDIRTGDTFSISLPDSHYFRVYEENGSLLQLKNTVTGETYGSGSLTGNHLVVTINEAGAKKKDWSALQLSVKAKAIKAGDGICAGGNSSAKISTLEIIDPNLPIADLVQAEVKVSGVGRLETPKNFEYVLADKTDAMKPVAYGITERKVTQKGELVKVVFYKHKTDQANFLEKIEGNSGPLGWRTLLKDNHSYLICEVSDSDYLAVITGGVGEGYQYDFQADNNQTAHFMILNQTKTKEKLSTDFAAVSATMIPQIKKKSSNESSPSNQSGTSSDESFEKDSNKEKGINLIKTDSVTGERLQGAEFELKNAAGDKMYLRKKLITNESGLLHLHPLPIGEYTLVEIEAPEGYELDSEPLKFSYTEEDALVELTKENTKSENLPIKKEFPKKAESSTSSVKEQMSRSVPSSPKKQYPNTGMAETVPLSLLGCGLLAGLWGLWERRK